MSKTTNEKNKLLKVKIGSVDEFISNVKSSMRSADKKQSIKSQIKTLTFEDPLEMLCFLNAVKYSISFYV